MKPRGNARAAWRFFAALFTVAFVLNWLWEMLQMPAFDDTAGRSWRSTALMCTAASLVDVAITLGIYLVVALVLRRRLWGLGSSWRHYLAAALLGMAVAVAIERISVPLGLWSYSSLMPIVPVTEVGLWPMLQLTLLVPIAIRLAAWQQPGELA